MTATNSVTSIVLVAFLTFVGFQNCSRVNFAPMEESLTGKAGLGDGLEDADFPEDEISNPVDAPNRANCQSFANNLNDSDFDLVISQDTVSIHKFRGSLKIADSNFLDLTNIRGMVFARTTSSKHLRNMRGDLCLVGNQDASLEYLNNHRGNIEFVGVNVARTNNTRGTIVVNGGHVDLISNHCGNVIKENGGTVGEIRYKNCDSTRHKDPS